MRARSTDAAMRGSFPPSFHQTLHRASERLSPRAALVSTSVAIQTQGGAFNVCGETAFFAASTTQGAVRPYNEDRICIRANIAPRSGWTEANWPVCSFFGVFDGHGGALCVEFLRDNLATLILAEQCFPTDVPTAIARGCQRAEEEFCRMARKCIPVERSGSCAVFALIVDGRVFVGNIGDCRALALTAGRVVSLSRDHKPDDRAERARIERAGGYVSRGARGLVAFFQRWIGRAPYRVYPGGLSVARAFGDVHAKDSRLGGVAGALVATAEVSAYSLGPTTQYIVLGCDGVFDKLSNEGIAAAIGAVWNARGAPTQRSALCYRTAEAIIGAALRAKSSDNLTAIFVSLKA